MLLRPKRIPRRYNRQVSAHTRTLLQNRRRNKRRYAMERWKRLAVRITHRLGNLRHSIVRVGLFAVVGLIPIAVIIVIFSPLLRLQTITVDRSNPRVNVETVMHALAPLFGKRLFFLSAQEIAPLLAPDIPDLASADARKIYPDTLSVSLHFDPIAARLRILEPGESRTSSETAGTGALRADYLTEKGLYVSYAPAQVSSGSMLPVYTLTDWGVRPVPGTAPFDPGILTALPAAEKTLFESYEQRVKERLIFVRAREFHLRVGELMLWFDLRSPIEQQLNRYRLFLQAVGLKGAKQYVDLRLSGRVVYR